MPIATARLPGPRHRPRSFWTTREAFLADAGLFLLGYAGVYSINIVGALPGCELLLFPMLPLLLLARGKRAFDRQYLWFYVLVGGWLLGTLIADAYNDIGIFNREKGTARVVFFALDFMALAILINKKTHRIVIFALSSAAVSLIGSLQFGDFLLKWKFGISEGLGVLALLGASYFYSRQRYWACFSVSVIMAGLNLIYGFRTQLGVQIVAGVLVLPLSSKSRAGQRGASGNRDTLRVVMLLALAAGAAMVANTAIKYAAGSGLFDESTQAKFEGQAKGDYGVLVGGRPETLVAIQAIRDSPIIGHGSFPYGLKYLQMKQHIQYEHGYSDSDEPEEEVYPVIPTHSHLTLAWVEGGILGGICWIYILILTLRAVLRLNFLRPKLAPLYSYLLVGFLWDILYSPFGSVNRIWAAYFILLSYFIMTSAPAVEQQASQVRLKRVYGRPLRLARRATP